MHEEYDPNEFPRLRPPQAEMPNKMRLKRSLIPANAPVILVPDLSVTFPDKARLKHIAEPSAGRVIRMGWSAWATGAAAAAVAVMVWFATPDTSPLAPAPAPDRLAAIPARAAAWPVDPPTVIPSSFAAFTAEDRSTAAAVQEPKIEDEPAIAITSLETLAALSIPTPPVASGSQLLLPTSEFGPEEETLLLAAQETPTSRERLQSGQEALAAFIADQPIGGAIDRVKSFAESLQSARRDVPAQAREARILAQQRTRDIRDAIRTKREAVEESIETSLKRWEWKDWQSPPWRSQP
jgi:hypothetical protein